MGRGKRQHSRRAASTKDARQDDSRQREFNSQDVVSLKDEIAQCDACHVVRRRSDPGESTSVAVGFSAQSDGAPHPKDDAIAC